jgi:hypothetical protein
MGRLVYVETTASSDSGWQTSASRTVPLRVPVLGEVAEWSKAAVLKDVFAEAIVPQE